MSLSEQSRYEDLLKRYLKPLRRLAWSYARDGAEGDDLLQEIALALWTALPRFRAESSERTWVYRVAHNTGLSYIAGHKRRTSREQIVVPRIEPAGGSNPEVEAIDREQVRRLRGAIQDLPLPDRQIVVLYLEGMTAADIEAVTGFSSGSIAARLTRVRHRLRVRLRGEEVRG